jgi:hypothetical protein
MELLSAWLPQAPRLHLETWQINAATAQVTLWAQSTQTRGHRPVCRGPTRRIHSHNTRAAADLLWAHYRVVLQLRVRKFFYANGRCARRIFTERLLGVVAPLARRTARLRRGLQRRQSRCTPPLEYGPRGGVHQSPHNAQAPVVWARLDLLSHRFGRALGGGQGDTPSGALAA